MHVRERIQRETEARVAECAGAGRAAIDARLAEIDREKDVDERLMLGGAVATALGLTLGTLVDRRFLVIPAVAATFLASRALFGWKPPPMLVMRQLGVRTREEIENERYALKALRGDFRDLPAVPDPSAVGSTDRAIRAAAV